MTVYVLNKTQTVTGPGQIVPMTAQANGGWYNPPTQTFQAVVTGTGSVSATVQLNGSNDGVNWTAIGSGITITSGTSPQNGAQVSNTTYQYYQANITALTGTSASVTTTMAV